MLDKLSDNEKRLCCPQTAGEEQENTLVHAHVVTSKSDYKTMREPTNSAGKNTHTHTHASQPASVDVDWWSR